jgi:hypothetical protein
LSDWSGKLRRAASATSKRDRLRVSHAFSARATMRTSAPPPTVWDIWSDTGTWAKWNPDVISARLDGPLLPGTTGTLVTKAARHNIIISTVMPGRMFALEARLLPGVMLRFTCAIEPSGDGSQIGQSVDVCGLASRLFGRRMAVLIARTFPPILTALRSEAESRTNHAT